MANIKIKIDALEAKIQQLKTLEKEISSNNTTSPQVVGGGSSVNELEKMADMYKTLNSSLSVLVTSTISFMDSVKASYVGSDKKAAVKISAK